MPEDNAALERRIKALETTIAILIRNGLEQALAASLFANAAANQGTSKQGARADHQLASHGDTLPAATIVQTYATAALTHVALTAAAVLETASTQTTPYGYATAAQADGLPASLNDLRDDMTHLKQVVNGLIDAMQAVGIVG